MGSGHGRAAPAVTPPDDSGGHDPHAPEAVDFDALHAALGDPLALDELPDDFDDDDDGHDPRAHRHLTETRDYGEYGPGELPDDEDTGEQSDDEDTDEHEERIGESDGRSSAQYASSRPHTIPPSLVTVEDLNAPPVIVSAPIEDTVPSAPPQMTVPLASRPVGHTPQSGVPVAAPAHRASTPSMPSVPSGPGSSPHPASGPQHLTAPLSSPHLAAGAMPGPHVVGEAAYPRSASHMTVRMPDRPLGALPPGINQRRGKVETLVVRPRGPSAKQKLFAFMAMLLLVTACGIAVIFWRKPAWIGLDGPMSIPNVTQTASPAAPTPVVPAPATEPAPATAVTAAASVTAMPAPPLPSASASSASGASGAVPAPKPKPRVAPAPVPSASR